MAKLKSTRAETYLTGAKKCTYFVTFRLADSLPKAVLQKLVSQRNDWLIDHGISPSDPCLGKLISELPEDQRRSYQRLFASSLNRELDSGYGACVLERSEVAQVVADALAFHHETRLLLGDYVVMPNHVHA